MKIKLSNGLKRKKVVKTVVRIGLALFLLSVTTVVIIGATPPAVPMTPSGLRQMQSVYVTMQDGTKIAVRLALPSGLEKEQRIPTIIEATRYLTDIKSTFLLNIALKLSGDVRANLGSGHVFLEQGYAFVRVDTRGSGASFGSREMEWSKQEIADIGEVMDWVIRQPWSNGKIGTYGISLFRCGSRNYGL